MTADWVEIDRVPVGIPGLDLITYGGLTRDRLTLVSGTAGSGKTVFANQFLAVGIRDADEPGVFVTFEERPEAIRRNVRSFGWDVGAWEEAAKWRFVDASPRHEVETVFTGGSYDLQPLLARVLGAVDEIGARRAALDSVGALIAQFEASAPARHIIFRLADALRERGVTTVMTAERSEDYGPVAAHGFEEFVADNVVILRNALEGEKRRRTVEVLKMRGGAHLKGEHLFTLLPGTGMVVVPVAISAAPHYVSTERATSGNDVLDRMLGGGLFEKSLALVAGATGTGKSLLSAQFIHGGARRGERVLLHSFEEGRDQLIRNATNWARYTLRTAAMLERRPSGVLQVLNDALLQRGEAESFCSAVFARLRPGKDGASGELVVAGHPPPLLRRATGEVERLETGGALLGIMNADVTLRVSLSLRRGDVLVLYTDGVTEARRDGELFGEDRLVEVVAGAGGSAEEVAGAIEAAVDGFGDHDRADDVAILAISPTDEVR